MRDSIVSQQPSSCISQEERCSHGAVATDTQLWQMNCWAIRTNHTSRWSNVLLGCRVIKDINEQTRGWENLWDCCSCCWLSPCWREPRSQRRAGNNKIRLLLWFICIFLLAMYVCLPPLQDGNPTADGTCLIFKNTFSNLWIHGFL